MYAGADKDEEISDEDGDTRLSCDSMEKKISKTASKKPKTSSKKQKRGANTPWLDTMKDNIADFIPLEDNQYVQVACEAALIASLFQQEGHQAVVGSHQGAHCT